MDFSRVWDGEGVRWHAFCIHDYNVDMLNSEILEAALPDGRFGRPLVFYESIGSTNEVALQWARRGAPHGALVVADEQTAGRGRKGRRWLTPRGSALAMSLILRPSGVLSRGLSSLTALGALAIVDAVEREGVPCEIKWPNDVLIRGRKAAGGLVEAAWEDGQLTHAVVGIGVNVAPASVPPNPEVDFPATCVAWGAGREVERVRLLCEIACSLERWYSRLGTAELLAAWEARLAYRGEAVIVSEGEREVVGRMLGLSQEGRLRVRTTDGGDVEFVDGEVSLRPVDMAGESDTLGAPFGGSEVGNDVR